MEVIVFHSGNCGNAKNCLYPHSGTGSTPDELKKLFCYDHTFIRFKNNYRSKENFLEASVATLDNDNDHSDDPADWIPIAAIPGLFPGVPCVVSTSRHHMKQKGNHSPRPRYHVAFQIDTIQSPEEYTAFLTRVQALFPFFDGNALDAGRFFFGNPDTEVYTFPGHRSLTAFIEDLEEQENVVTLEDAVSAVQIGSIPEGSRNSTVSHAAGKILKRWGDTSEAYEKFMEVVAQCSPPLPDFEVSSTWKSAVRFFHEKVKRQPFSQAPVSRGISDRYHSDARRIYRIPDPSTGTVPFL